MKRIHYLLLGLLVSLTIAAVSPTMPPTRIAPGTGVTVVTNGFNAFTISASGGSSTNTPLLNGTNVFTGTNTFGGPVTVTNFTAYSSGTTNRPFRAFGTNGTSEVYVDKDATLNGFRASLTGDLYLLDAIGYGCRVTGNSAVVASEFGVASSTGAAYFAANSSTIGLPSTIKFGGSVQLWTGYTDQTLKLVAGSGVLSQENGAANPQTNRLYHTYTDANNHQRLALYTTTNSVNIAAETAGTGADDININLLPAGTGGVVIGSGGAGITKVLSATATLNFDLTVLVVEDLTITVTGAASGDTVSIGVPAGSVTATVQFTGWVSAADTVTIRARTSVVGENPASGTFRATVTKF